MLAIRPTFKMDALVDVETTVTVTFPAVNLNGANPRDECLMQGMQSTE